MVALAVIPGIVLLIYIWKKDSVENEPMQLLLKLFMWGAATVVSAFILENIGFFLVGLVLPTDSMVYLAIENFLLVALVEEGGKYVIFKWKAWNNREFDHTFDAIVYCVAISLGFATLENVGYLIGETIDLAIMRGLFAVPGHMIDAIFMGYYLGIAKYYSVYGNQKEFKSNMTKGLWVPVLLHGFYDFCLSTGSDLFLIIFFVFEIGLTIYTINRINYLSKRDTPLYGFTNYWSNNPPTQPPVNSYSNTPVNNYPNTPANYSNTSVNNYPNTPVNNYPPQDNNGNHL